MIGRGVYYIFIYILLFILIGHTPYVYPCHVLYMIVGMKHGGLGKSTWQQYIFNGSLPHKFAVLTHFAGQTHFAGHSILGDYAYFGTCLHGLTSPYLLLFAAMILHPFPFL